MKSLKKYLLTSIGFGAFFLAKAQNIDSLFFNLYTDSLKKGGYNYINVDGRLSNGQWIPLTGKQLTFSSSAGVFEGNNLYIDSTFKGEKITVKVILKSDPSVRKETIIYIKKYSSPEQLKTVEELLKEPTGKGKRNKKSTG